MSMETHPENELSGRSVSRRTGPNGALTHSFMYPHHSPLNRGLLLTVKNTQMQEVKENREGMSEISTRVKEEKPASMILLTV